MEQAAKAEPVPSLPGAPALAVGVRGAAWATGAGGVETVAHAEATRRLHGGAQPLVCHARAAARRLGTAPFAALDLLELFAFVRPAVFCLPTPRGLAQALGLPIPAGVEAEAESLFAAARALLSELAYAGDGVVAATAWAMARGGWRWGAPVLAVLGVDGVPRGASHGEGLRAWARLPEWQETAPEAAPASWPVEPVEARARLVRMLGPGAEARPGQRDYAAAAAAAFRPRDKSGEPALVLADAGTGVGKTLGYIAPASVWAEKNKGPVWISTYTRNLQRQLDAELDRLFPDPAEKAAKVVIRKGRENYLCLLNLEEAASRLRSGPADAVALGLVSRWALASRDGDMVGGDFPSWLVDLVGRGATVDLTDTRGECIYSACAHFRKCFIERSIRRARRAELVVANHALVMTQAALGGEGTAPPTRYVFDEGHHVFAAADGAFSADLTGAEAAELRRWLLGAEEPGRSRSRGLRARIGDLAALSDRAGEALDQALAAARALPGPGWRQRLAGGQPLGAAEAFLTRVRQQVLARDRDSESGYDLEAEVGPPVPGLIEAAAALTMALDVLRVPVARLVAALAALLDDEAADLDTASRNRIEAVSRGLERRGVMQTQAWSAMLASLVQGPAEEFVDWFSIEREGGREVDVGMHRHWLDPTRPFATAVIEPAHGVLVTSATLRDAEVGGGDGWASAEARTGARHVARPAERAAVASPFDYPANTLVLVVTDVGRGSADQVAAAYRELFMAAGGGGLGLFTAIARLKAVHQRIAAPLEAAGIPLLAQHVDPLDTGTLIDIFRAEEDACLLGTDAVRDGIDVPGRSLRLIVFERVPWPRPDILHKARRAAFGGQAYDDMLTRLRLKQAFGRLVRRADDRGVFVLLDRAFPSRLIGAFPAGVRVARIGLAAAVAEARAFFADRP